MNNFEMNDLTQQLVDGYTPYQLAKALIKSVQSEVSLLDNGCGNDVDFTRNLMRKLGNKQTINIDMNL